MKVANVSLNKESGIIDVVYTHSSPLTLNFVVSDLEMDCTYYTWEVELTTNSSVWISPLSPELRTVVKQSKTFSGFCLKIYHNHRLLQTEYLPYNSNRFHKLHQFHTSEYDEVGASYIDFFHGGLCEGIDTTGVVVDAGANVGFFTLYAEINGAKRIYSIEPDAFPFFYLNKNFYNKPTVITINKALSTDCNGTEFFHVLGGSVASSQYKVTDDSVVGFVETIDMNTICSIESNINLVKMDVEGSEFAILKSLSSKNFRKINQFFVEFHSNPSELYTIFQAHGFKTECKRTNETNTAGFIYAYC